MKVFFDNCLPPRTAKALQALDGQNQIVHLRERFPRDIKDLDWLPQLAREGGWVLVTIDQIHRVPLQRQALQAGGFVCFFLKKGWNQPLWLQASRFFAWWPLITDQAARARPGTAFRVPFAALLEGVRERGIIPLIPKVNSKIHGSGLGRTRYVVERSLAWFGHNRRLKLCYERTPEHFQAFHDLAAAIICANRLASIKRRVLK